MEEVLEDRAITLILEKSNHPLKTRLVEDFEENEVIKYILKNIGLCSLCNVVSLKNINLHWNNYISKKYKTTLTTHTTLNTLTTQTTYTPPNHPLFDKVHESNIIGRDLELFLPLFFMAEFLGQEIEVEILRIAKEISASKKEDQKIESVDIMVYDFISRKDSSIFNYHSVKLLTNEFRDFSGETDDEINSKWFGRALKRLNLIINKRRKTQGMEIVLDVAKAQNKFKMFKK